MSKEKERQPETTEQTGRIFIKNTEYLIIDDVIYQSPVNINQHNMIKHENYAHERWKRWHSFNIQNIYDGNVSLSRN